MTCKGAGGAKKKYMYYHCEEDGLYFREDLIEKDLMPFIMNLVEYDMTVKRYFFPVLADKKVKDTSKLDKEISSLKAQKTRIKDAYIKGIVEVEDFSEDYKVIENKLNLLEQKRIESIDFNKQSFSPQKLMADRDVAKEKLVRSNRLTDVLMEEWNAKNKEEKQEFISKFIENMTLERVGKEHFDIKNINLRSNFLEQIYKLMENGMFDVMVPTENNNGSVPATLLMDKNDLKEYLDRINNYYEVSYYELYNLDNGYKKKFITTDKTNENGEKLFKLVELVTDNKTFPIKKDNRIIGAIRIKDKEKK